MKKFPLVVVALALLLSGFSLNAGAEEPKGGLFVNLTTDDTWAAAKAIMFAAVDCASQDDALGSWILPRLLAELLAFSVKNKASDLHLSPACRR
jgi:hypothetical protein